MQSELKLYVDGVLKQKAIFKYPPITEPLKSARIGTNADAARATPGHLFWGQMGALYLFDDALSPAQIKAVASLGPNYSGVFMMSEYAARLCCLSVCLPAPSLTLDFAAFRRRAWTAASLRRSTGPSLPTSSSRTRPARLRCCPVYATASFPAAAPRCLSCVLQGPVFMDNTPEKNREAQASLSQDSMGLGSLTPCCTRDVKDMLYCLGGIKVFLLFLLLHTSRHRVTRPWSAFAPLTDVRTGAAAVVRPARSACCSHSGTAIYISLSPASRSVSLLHSLHLLLFD